MTTAYRITHLQADPAPEDTRRDGLRAYLRFQVCGLKFDGVMLRTTADGQWTLSYPLRVDRHGITHYPVRPADDEARQAIESAVFAALDRLTEGRP